jgi:Uma2 family endonuclease
MAAPQTVPVHRLTLDDVFAMVEAGILNERSRVELEGGVLVEMVPPGEGHGDRVEWLIRHFVKAAGDDVRVRVQDTFLIPDGGYYQPDVIVFGPKDDQLPRTAKLIIGVAVSSYRRRSTSRRSTSPRSSAERIRR